MGNQPQGAVRAHGARGSGSGVRHGTARRESGAGEGRDDIRLLPVTQAGVAAVEVVQGRGHLRHDRFQGCNKRVELGRRRSGHDAERLSGNISLDGGRTSAHGVGDEGQRVVVRRHGGQDVHLSLRQAHTAQGLDRDGSDAAACHGVRHSNTQLGCALNGGVEVVVEPVRLRRQLLCLVQWGRVAQQRGAEHARVVQARNVITGGDDPRKNGRQGHSANIHNAEGRQQTQRRVHVGFGGEQGAVLARGHHAGAVQSNKRGTQLMSIGLRLHRKRKSRIRGYISQQAAEAVQRGVAGSGQRVRRIHTGRRQTQRALLRYRAVSLRLGRHDGVADEFQVRRGTRSDRGAQVTNQGGAASRRSIGSPRGRNGSGVGGRLCADAGLENVRHSAGGSEGSHSAHKRLQRRHLHCAGGSSPNTADVGAQGRHSVQRGATAAKGESVGQR